MSLRLPGAKDLQRLPTSWISGWVIHCRLLWLRHGNNTRVGGPWSVAPKRVCGLAPKKPPPYVCGYNRALMPRSFLGNPLNKPLQFSKGDVPLTGDLVKGATSL